MEKKEQLIKLISGNLDSIQKEKLLNEIKSDKSIRDEFESLKNTFALSTIEQDMDIRKIENSYLSFKKKKFSNSKSRNLFLNLIKYAAIVIVFFMLGIFVRQYTAWSPVKSVFTSTNNNQIFVPNGDKVELTLTDGSKVWLNAGTTFEFPKTFDNQCRKVTLSGEAFFEVKKGHVPFIVNTDYGIIEVLGTSFNVRAYDNLDFQTTLKTGKILFKNSETAKELNPCQQLTCSAKEGIIIKKINPELVLSWKNGIITFDNEPLDDVAKKLERHFNITITLDQDIAPIRFTGRIYEESIDEVMTYINKTKPINYAYDRNLRSLTIKSIN